MAVIIAVRNVIRGSKINKVKLLGFLLLILSSYKCAEKKGVYLCDSPNATKYHYNENCRGLKACKHPIIQVTLEEARKLRKTLCGWEK